MGHDGQNITIERRSAEGHTDRYLVLTHEMVGLKVDVLVILGAPSFVLAAHQATRTIPIVMAGLSVDPVGLGVANSFASPGATCPGQLSSLDRSWDGKRLQLLKEVAGELLKAMREPGLKLEDVSSACDSLFA